MSEKIIVKTNKSAEPVVAQSIQAEPIDGASLIAPIIPEMPEPTKAAVETVSANEQAPATPQPGALPVSPVTQIPEASLNVPNVKDSEGTQFDPSLHRSDSNGNPRFGATGKFLKKYKAGANDAPRSTPAAPEIVSGNPGIPDQFDNAAEMALQTSYGLVASFFTNDIRPDSQEEHLSLKIPLAAVLREKGNIGLSNTQLLMVSIAAYISKKAAKPTIRERFVLFYLRAKALIKGEKFVEPKKPEEIENTK